MKWLNEIIDKGNIPPPAILKNFAKTVGPLSYAIARNPKTVIANKKAWGERLKKSRAPWAHLEDESEHDTTLLFDEDDYQDLLPVRDEKYLRPTRLCEYDAPEIRILAKKLGAYDKEPIEYAKSIYYFVKNQKYLIFKPMRGALGVLKSRGGVCLDQMSLLISLARAGGIKARFRLYAFTASQELDELLLQDNPILRETYEMLGFLDSLHGCAELLIDGEWIQLDPTFSDELEAGMGLPLTQFGEEPSWRTRIPERDIVFEGFPLMVRSLLIGMAFLLRDTVDKVNKKLDDIREEGRKILDEVGREAYNEKKKKKAKISVPNIYEVRAFRQSQNAIVEEVV
ncbi:MAG: hypothetical protein DRN33_00895 [Thermoplasmata archaeon]|nr:MAG: hypothetical protein DRN33_00895 [Thermoplasmata archaeon]